MTTTQAHSPPDAAVRASAVAASEQHRAVLATINDDGSRRWLRPRLSPGRFLSARRAVAYLLIALFIGLPFMRIGSKPVLLLDLVARRFHVLGTTFYPTDTLLLALLAVMLFLSIIWFTVIAGRLWCGWACPQTVYLEFVFRPIERFFDGATGKGRFAWLQTTGLGTALKYACYLACAGALAHVFLAYFVPWSQLRHWVVGSPTEHPVGFGVVAFITLAMMLDFAYFREQICLVMCPYGRFQSVLLDRFSMIIRYDAKRGEPRGRKAAASISLPVLGNSTAVSTGDCIDCRMCVTTCPTGIDIRNGLQMECIGCAQCIDACDKVMDKIGRDRGLIRYSSQAVMDGEPFRWIRPRVLLYPAVLLLLAGIFMIVLFNTGTADVTILRGLGQPFTLMSDTEVRNTIRVKIVNRLDHPAEFTLSVQGVPGARLHAEHQIVRVDSGKMLTAPAEIYAPRDAFNAGRAQASISVTGPENYSATLPFTLLGPAGAQSEKRP
jgi:cytochrome c oxidase accessory protein FixG